MIKKETIFSIVAGLISLIALFTSFKSCSIAKESLEITKTEYSEKFLTIWNFEYIKNKEVFQMTPSNDSAILQNAIVHYPDSISITEWNIRFPEKYLYVTVPKFYISEQVEQVISPINDNFRILDNGSVPLILEVYYTVNGQNLKDISLYMMRYTATITDDFNSHPKIEFTTISFGGRLEQNVKKKNFLNDAWNITIDRLKNLK